VKAQQSKSNKTGPEPNLSAKDGEDTQAQSANRYERNQNVPAH
jgi:hypothetical protein